MVGMIRELAGSLLIPNTFQGISQGMRAVLVPMFAKHLGLSDAAISLVISVGGLARAVGDVPAGVLTSLYGFKLVMVLAMLLSCVGVLICTFSWNSITLAGGSLWVGGSLGMFIVARHCFLVVAVEKQRRGRVMSILGGIARWSNVLGPIFAGLLSDFAGLQCAFLAIVPMSLVCALMVWNSPLVNEHDKLDKLSRYEKNSAAGSEEHSIAAMITSVREHGHLILRVGVFSLNVVSLQQCRKLMLTLAALNFGLSNSTVGVTLAIGFSIDASLFFIGGWVTDHYGIKFSAVPTTVNMGLAFLALPFATTVSRLILVGILFGLAGSLGSGLLLTLAANNAPKSAGPPFLGMMRTMQDIGLLLGPLLAATLIHAASFSTACKVLGGIGVINGIWAIKMFPNDSFNTEIAAHDPTPRTQLQENMEDDDESITDGTKMISRSE
jgi:MFS family permease